MSPKLFAPAVSPVAHLLPSMTQEGPGRNFERLRASARAGRKLPNTLPADALHRQAVFRTFARPHEMEAGDMLGHFRAIWQEYGFLQAPEMLLRFNERVVPGFKADDKLVQAVRSNFQLSPLTGAPNADAGAVNQGLGHLFCKEYNWPCALIVGDIRNLRGGVNDMSKTLHGQAGVADGKPDAVTPLRWQAAPWLQHADRIVRTMFTRVASAMQHEGDQIVVGTGRPSPLLQLRGEGGDEVSMLAMGVSKQEVEFGLSPPAYTKAEEVVTRLGLLHIPHSKRSDEIGARGTGIALGVIDMDSPRPFKERKRRALQEASLGDLVIGTIRHLSATPSARRVIETQFMERVEEIARPDKDTPPSKKQRLACLTHCTMLAETMKIHLLDPRNIGVYYKGPPLTGRIMTGLRNTMHDVADMLRPRHESWRSDHPTQMPLQYAGSRGYTLQVPDKQKARDILSAQRDVLDFLTLPETATPPSDPFNRHSRRAGASHRLFEPTWLERRPKVLRHLRRHYTGLSPAQAGQLAQSISGTPAIDPPTGLLMASAFGPELERWSADSRQLQKYAADQLRPGAGASDKLLIGALAKALGPKGYHVLQEDVRKAAPAKAHRRVSLKRWIILVNCTGITGFNSQYGHGNTDLWLGDLAKKLEETGHPHGFHLWRENETGRGQSNCIGAHFGAGLMAVLVPPLVEDAKGNPVIVDKDHVRAWGHDFRKMVESLNPQPAKAYLQQLGGAMPREASDRTLGEIVNPRNARDVGLTAFVTITSANTPIPGANPGLQMVRTLQKFDRAAEPRRLEKRYESLHARLAATEMAVRQPLRPLAGKSPKNG